MLARVVMFVVVSAGCAGADGTQGPTGPMGAMGEKGDPGPAGPAGTNGGAWRPEAWLYCGVTLDLIAPSPSGGGSVPGKNGIAETYLQYELVLYTNGDAEVRCSAGIGSAQDGSGNRYYPSPTKGSTSRYCSASADFIDSAAPTTEVGFWAFTAESQVSVSYRDSDNPYGFNDNYYDFTAEDCTAATMDDKGEWTAASIEDVL